MVAAFSGVVICFQISTFVGSSTETPGAGHMAQVVICFQISTFVGSSTGSRTSMNATITL